MTGRVKGVQKRIRDKAPSAFYVHCHGHRLNLVLVRRGRQSPRSMTSSVSWRSISINSRKHSLIENDISS